MLGLCWGVSVPAHWTAFLVVASVPCQQLPRPDRPCAISSLPFLPGILLYELISGLRAYAGVAIPLLPHEVAVQGLRPEWPRKMPADFDGLRRLAEACWQQKPSDRCVQCLAAGGCHVASLAPCLTQVPACLGSWRQHRVFNHSQQSCLVWVSLCLSRLALRHIESHAVFHAVRAGRPLMQS